jgi:hypothetical protein
MYVDGFFMDRGTSPRRPSTAEDIYADGRNGRQVRANDSPTALPGCDERTDGERRPVWFRLLVRPTPGANRGRAGAATRTVATA